MKDNKELIVGMSLANEMSENTEKKEEAYSEVDRKINQRNKEREQN